MIREFLQLLNQLSAAFWKSAIETPEEWVKSVQLTGSGVFIFNFEQVTVDLGIDRLQITDCNFKVKFLS